MSNLFNVIKEIIVQLNNSIKKTPQKLTEDEKLQARRNIDAGTPQLQSDWCEQDGNSVSYIKNKTHYHIPRSVYKICSFSGQIDASTSTNIYRHDSDVRGPIPHYSVLDGGKYIVTVNGMDFNCTGEIETDDGEYEHYCLSYGDDMISWKLSCRILDNVLEYDFISNKDGDYSIRLYRVIQEESIKPLADMFIPESIARKTDIPITDSELDDLLNQLNQMDGD